MNDAKCKMLCCMAKRLSAMHTICIYPNGLLKTTATSTRRASRGGGVHCEMGPVLPIRFEDMYLLRCTRRTHTHELRSDEADMNMGR